MRIAITPDRIAAHHAGNVVEFPLRTTQGLPDASDLQQALAKISPQKNTEVVLSQAIATTWLLPAPAVMLKASEIESWAADMLAQRIGPRAAELALGWDTPPPGAPVLVTGMDAAFLGALTDALDRTGHQPIRIEPWLAVAYRDHKKELATADAWLAIAEPGWVSFARFSDAGPQVLRQSQCDPTHDNPAALLAQMLQRETLISGSSKAQLVLLNAVGLATSAANVRGLPLHPQSSIHQKMHAMLGAHHA